MCHQQQQQQPRFHLLLAWCLLLTVAVLAMAAMLTAPARKQDASGASRTAGDPHTDAQWSSPRNYTGDHRFPHIQLTMEVKNKEYTWTRDLELHATSNSGLFDIRNNSVFINVEGLYFFYAHATSKCNTKSTVTLFRNAIPRQKSLKTLSTAVVSGTGEHTISLSKVASCEKGDSLRLEIHPTDCFKFNSDKTYWGFFLLPPHPWQ